LNLCAVAAALALSAATASPGTCAEKQRTFATPEEAVASLVAAAEAGGSAELQQVLGPGSKKLVSSGDPVDDANARRKFVTEYHEKNELQRESDTRVVLAVGSDGWTFPFPIVKADGGWRFDASAGAEEILERRIGKNELDAIEVSHAYVDAQREYAEQDRNHDGYVEYAQKFLSSPGQKDGLYWPTEPGEDESPMGPLVVSAQVEGYGGEPHGAPRPYHGYYYRILKGQGPAAKGGAYDYVVNGHMMGGFALIASPAEYGASGIMTFIVNHDDVVYQKDLGPKTAELAKEITLFNPDSTWKPE
jgi:hypothetical protein